MKYNVKERTSLHDNKSKIINALYVQLLKNDEYLCKKINIGFNGLIITVGT